MKKDIRITHFIKWIKQLRLSIFLVTHSNKVKMKDLNQLLALLGDEKDFLLNHVCKTISKDQIHLPDSAHIDAHFCKVIVMHNPFEA